MASFKCRKMVNMSHLHYLDLAAGFFSTLEAEAQSIGVNISTVLLGTRNTSKQLITGLRGHYVFTIYMVD